MRNIKKKGREKTKTDIYYKNRGKAEDVKQERHCRASLYGVLHHSLASQEDSAQLIAEIDSDSRDRRVCFSNKREL